jgi:hypothetical protein
VRFGEIFNPSRTGWSWEYPIEEMRIKERVNNRIVLFIIHPNLIVTFWGSLKQKYIIQSSIQGYLSGFYPKVINGVNQVLGVGG